MKEELDLIAQKGINAFEIFKKQQILLKGETNSEGSSLVAQGNPLEVIYDQSELTAEGVDYTKPEWTAEQFMSVTIVAEMTAFPKLTFVALNLQNPARRKQVDILIRQMMRGFVFNIFMLVAGIYALIMLVYVLILIF